MKMDSKTFGEILRQKRVELGLLQKDVADKIFVSEKTISRWECGYGYPDIDMIKTLSRIYDTNLFLYLNDAEDVHGKIYSDLSFDNVKIWKLVVTLVFDATLIGVLFIPFYGLSLLTGIMMSPFFALLIGLPTYLLPLILFVISIISIIKKRSYLFLRNVLRILFIPLIFLVSFFEFPGTNMLICFISFISFVFEFYVFKRFNQERYKTIFTASITPFLTFLFAYSLYVFVNLVFKQPFGFVISSIIVGWALPAYMYYLLKEKYKLKTWLFVLISLVALLIIVTISSFDIVEIINQHNAFSWARNILVVFTIVGSLSTSGIVLLDYNR